MNIFTKIADKLFDVNTFFAVFFVVCLGAMVASFFLGQSRDAADAAELPTSTITIGQTVTATGGINH